LELPIYEPGRTNTRRDVPQTKGHVDETTLKADHFFLLFQCCFNLSQPRRCKGGMNVQILNQIVLHSTQPHQQSLMRIYKNPITVLEHLPQKVSSWIVLIQCEVVNTGEMRVFWI